MWLRHFAGPQKAGRAARRWGPARAILKGALLRPKSTIGAEAGTPVEIELKFQVPTRAWAAVESAVATASARTTPLDAIYYDTEDGRLAGAGWVLRVRREGRQWVQTLKGRGDGLLARAELAAALAPPRRGTAPLPAFAHHGDAPAARSAAALVGDAPLVAVYRVRVRRVHRVLAHAGARIELALDRGRIEAAGRSIAVRELEFELLAGETPTLLDVAARWQARHGLWLDVRPKSERAAQLARGAAPPVKAVPIALDRRSTCRAAFAAMLGSTLQQALANAAVLMDEAGDAEHLHQLRVGLRRVRTVLRWFGAWSAAPQLAAHLDAELRPTFARLGTQRDADVLAETLAAMPARDARPPQWRVPATAAGAPEPPGAVLREGPFSAQMLALLRLATPAPLGTDEPEVSLAVAAARLLGRGQRQIVAAARAFDSAAPAEQHRTRRRLKRLRYATELLQSLLPAKRCQRALDAMRDALDALGHHNDLLVAHDLLAALPDPTADERRALAWLLAQRAPARRRAARLLGRVAALPKWW